MIVRKINSDLMYEVDEAFLRHRSQRPAPWNPELVRVVLIALIVAVQDLQEKEQQRSNGGTD